MSTRERNLEALRRARPSLAAVFEQGLEGARVEVVRTPSGAVSARARREDGKWVWLHSRFDPEREARKLIDAHELEPSGAYIILGFGLGYHALELYKRCGPAATFLVFEKELEGIYRALDHVELADFMADPRVHLFLGVKKEEVYPCLRNLVQLLFSRQITLVAHPASLRVASDYFQGLREGLRDFIASGSMIFRSLVALPTRTFENRFRNLAAYVTSPPAERFRGVLEGYPAIVVSAGPSLARNFESLRKARGRAALLAVSTSFKRMLAASLPPDFTGTLDYHRISARYFEAAGDEVSVPMLCDARGAHEAMQAYRGPRFFYADAMLDLVLEELSLQQGRLEPGSTVSHLMFHFAEFLGADPIIFVGQDLSYSYGVSHVPGTAIYDQWFAETNRFHTFELKEWEFIQRLRNQLVRIEDVFGHPVWTDEMMFSYLKEFELVCQVSPARCINATEGGAKLMATEAMSLEEAIGQFCTRPLAQDSLRCEPLGDEEARKRLETARALVERRRGESEEVGKAARRGLRLLRAARRKLDRGQSADSFARRAQQLNPVFSQHKKIYQLLVSLAKSDDLVRLQADRRIRSDDLQGVEKQREQTERDVEFLTGLGNANDRLQEMFSDALELIDRKLCEGPP